MYWRFFIDVFIDVFIGDFLLMTINQILDDNPNIEPQIKLIKIQMVYPFS